MASMKLGINGSWGVWEHNGLALEATLVTHSNDLSWVVLSRCCSNDPFLNCLNEACELRKDLKFWCFYRKKNINYLV